MKHLFLIFIISCVSFVNSAQNYNSRAEKSPFFFIKTPVLKNGRWFLKAQPKNVPVSSCPYWFQLSSNLNFDNPIVLSSRIRDGHLTSSCNKSDKPYFIRVVKQYTNVVVSDVLRLDVNFCGPMLPDKPSGNNGDDYFETYPLKIKRQTPIKESIRKEDLQIRYKKSVIPPWNVLFARKTNGILISWETLFKNQVQIEIQRKFNYENTWKIIGHARGGQSFLDKNVSSSAIVYYRVRVVNEFGGFSDYANCTGEGRGYIGTIGDFEAYELTVCLEDGNIEGENQKEVYNNAKGFVIGKVFDSFFEKALANVFKGVSGGPVSMLGAIETLSTIHKIVFGLFEKHGLVPVASMTFFDPLIENSAYSHFKIDVGEILKPGVILQTDNGGNIPAKLKLYLDASTRSNTGYTHGFLGSNYPSIPHEKRRATFRDYKPSLLFSTGVSHLQLYTSRSLYLLLPKHSGKIYLDGFSEKKRGVDILKKGKVYLRDAANFEDLYSYSETDKYVDYSLLKDEDVDCGFIFDTPLRHTFVLHVPQFKFKSQDKVIFDVSESRDTKSSFVSDGIEMVFVKGGTFQMGSNDGESDEKPIHTVTLSSFEIGKYEVTQKQWKKVMGSNPSYFKGDNLPVESVSWNDVQTFITKLNEQTGGNYRLPTEAEWEFAARGGTTSVSTTFAGSNTIGDVAWYGGNSGRKTHDVGGKQPNELSIYDMTGNVWELCSDWYGRLYYSISPTNNPQGPFGCDRVNRGGSWNFNTHSCRVAYRGEYNPSDRFFCIGFRLARSLSSSLNVKNNTKENKVHYEKKIESTQFSGTTLEQNGKKIELNAGLTYLTLKRTGFSLEFEVKSGVMDNGRGYGARIASTSDVADLKFFQERPESENQIFNVFSSIAMMKGEPNFLCVNNKGHQYIFYDNESNRRAELVKRKGNGKNRIRWNIDKFAINKRDVWIENSEINQLYIMIYIPRNQNEIIESGEYNLLKINFE